MATRYEYITQRISADWLKDFADNEAKKLSDKQAATPMENILDIVSRNKKTSVEAKVEELRQRVGLDMLNDSIEKSGKKENTKQASARPLSLRHKIALDQKVNEEFGRIKTFIQKIVESRNGKIDTPAMLDLLKDTLGVDQKWIKDNSDDLVKIILEIKKQYSPKHYHESISPELLAQPDNLENLHEAPWIPAQKSGD